MVDLNFPNPVTDEKEFYGPLKAELGRFERVFLSGKRIPVVILGERRIGKTSLQNVIAQRLRKTKPQRFVPLFIEPRGIDSLDEFVRSILQSLSSYLGKSLHDTGLFDVDKRFHLETIEQFGDAFLRLLEPESSETFLLCVDEFDEIVRNVGTDETSQLDALIHHLIRETRLPLTLLFTMTGLPEDIRKSYPTPFTDIAEIVELNPFTPTEMEDMVLGILQGQVVLPQRGIDWLFQLSGGHPYFTKLLLANLVERERPGEKLMVTDAMLQQVLQDAVDDPRANHAVDNIYRVRFVDNEKRVVLLLADRQGPVSVGELRKAGTPYLTAAKRLDKRDYLSEHGASYDFRIGFLGHWLRNWTEFEEELERLNVRRMIDPWAGSQPTIVTDEDLQRYGLEYD